MTFETINVLADSKDIKLLKDIVEKITEKLPSMPVPLFQYGKIGDSIVVSFKVEQRFHKLIVEKLIFNKLRVVTFDDKTKQYVDAAKYQSKMSSATASWSTSKVKPAQDEKKKTLDELIEEADYTEIIKISRDINIPKDEAEKARESIDNTILKAITIAYNEAQNKKFDINRNVEKLLKIASDNTLKTLQKMSYLKQAGLYAVEICSKNKDYVGDLINICNNNALHNLVNIKAAVKFGEVILDNKELYKKEILIAKRNLNTRWLLIAFSAVENELSSVERQTFNELIDFIKQ
jgi:hypothetical protein